MRHRSSNPIVLAALAVTGMLGVLGPWMGTTTAVADEAPPRPRPAPKVQALLCRDYVDEKIIEPTVVYYPDSPKIQVVLKASASRKGGAITFVYIADDVGPAAPAGTRIDQKTIPLPPAIGPLRTWTAQSSLSRPNKGWPIGRYHVEVTIDGQQVATLPFTVQARK